jgi:hypothetical protein
MFDNSTVYAPLSGREAKAFASLSAALATNREPRSGGIR